MNRGIFITLEGGEGTGKSTQATLLSRKLKAANVRVLQTREPGGTEAAEEIRNLLVKGNPENWSPLSEALLMTAARDDHLQARIIPALKGGQFVICDRFADSTRAYQGYAGGVDKILLESLEAHVVGNYMPDLTLIFDLDPEIGLARARDRNSEKEDRFEAKGLKFHQEIRAAFLEIARQSPQRCLVVDASRARKDIEAAIWQIVRDRFL